MHLISMKVVHIGNNMVDASTGRKWEPIKQPVMYSTTIDGVEKDVGVWDLPDLKNLVGDGSDSLDNQLIFEVSKCVSVCLSLCVCH